MAVSAKGLSLELGERVANLEARLDAQGQDLADIRGSVKRLEDRMVDGFRELRTEMHTNFRWVMGGIGGAVLTIVLSILVQVLVR
jgi:BMFP domain-containing protein YqiC